jgi:hypothetical protein
MKGVQNKKKLHLGNLSYRYAVYVITIRKENSKSHFSCRLTRMRQLLTFSEFSNNVDTTGTRSIRVVAVQRRFRTQYGCQPPTWKIIRFCGNKLRTAASRSGIKSPGKTRNSEENVNRIR